MHSKGVITRGGLSVAGNWLLSACTAACLHSPALCSSNNNRWPWPAPRPVHTWMDQVVITPGPHQWAENTIRQLVRSVDRRHADFVHYILHLK